MAAENATDQLSTESSASKAVVFGVSSDMSSSSNQAAEGANSVGGSRYDLTSPLEVQTTTQPDSPAPTVGVKAPAVQPEQSSPRQPAGTGAADEPVLVSVPSTDDTSSGEVDESQSETVVEESEEAPIVDDLPTDPQAKLEVLKDAFPESPLTHVAPAPRPFKIARASRKSLTNTPSSTPVGVEKPVLRAVLTDAKPAEVETSELPGTGSVSANEFR